MNEGHPTNYGDSPALDIGQSLWQSCVDQLAQELPEQQFNTWIKPLSAQVQEDFSKVTIFVANRFKLDWVRPIQQPHCVHAGKALRSGNAG
jgi:chromosomal replication initiator protein